MRSAYRGNKKTYTPTAKDDGNYLRVRVTATNAVGSAEAFSSPPLLMSYKAPSGGGGGTGGGGTGGGSSGGPSNTVPPTAKIDPAAGTGSGTPGTWNGDLTGIDYQWQRCGAGDIASCSDIAGATKVLYTLTSVDAGQQLRLCVTAKTTGGFSTVCSPLTVTVAPSCRMITGTKTKWVTLRFKKGKKTAKTKVYFSSAQRLTEQSFIKVSVDHKKSTKKMTVKLNGKSVKGKNKRFVIKPWQLSTAAKQQLKVTVKDSKTGQTKTAKHAFSATACS